MTPTGFQDAVLAGLAPDGGLIVPAEWPDFSDRLKDWMPLPYDELAIEIMRPFVDLPDDALERLVRESYATFRHPEVAPVAPAGDRFILELFHGPTLAFKDIALQFLGRVFEYILEQRDADINVLAATSGDTGSAAIYGLRRKPRVRIFVLHPHGRVSPLQERQMTAVIDDRVFNVALEGTFDDCQRIMKSIFGDTAFKERYRLGAVNSVNWARVLAQMVYYFFAAFRVMERTGGDAVQFSVPTGNFGDILAGYYAARMGLPVRKLILATNENDILARFFQTGVYERGEVHATLSPSMDIQIASNFERYLFDCAGRDAGRLNGWMDAFARESRLDLSDMNRSDLLVAGRGDTSATLDTIRRVGEEAGMVLDPHTAVGVHVGDALRDPEVPLICLATAHPAKFPDAIQQATGRTVTHPILEALNDAETRQEILPAEEADVRSYLEAHIGN